MQNTLTFVLHGSFAVLSHSGADMLPIGTKTRALVALLVTSETLSRRRTWLQEKLWCDRGKEQRAASLRQALSELRKCWSDIPDALRTDRQAISLDPKYVVIDTSGKARGLEFLEDLVVQDAAFKDWLHFQRQQRNPGLQTVLLEESAPAAPKNRPISVICRSDFDPKAIALEQLFQDRLYTSLGECAGVFVQSRSGLATSPHELVCSVKAIVIEGAKPMLRVTVEAFPSHEMCFASTTELPVDILEAASCPQALQLCAQIVDAVSSLTTNTADDAYVVHNLVSKAISLMFTFQADRVQRASEMLELASKIDTNGQVSAWLIQALNIQYVERLITTDAAFLERAEELCRTVLQTSPANSAVLSCVANARINLKKDYSSGHELARQAVKLNNGNPLAWWALSNAELSIGRSEFALRSALNAKYLSQKTQFEFWTDFQVSLALTVLGEHTKAKEFGIRASALSPTFRPPSRYLIGLSALEGDIETARLHTNRLIEEEHDFNPLQLIDDDQYPAGFLRRLNDIQKDQVKGVALDL